MAPKFDPDKPRVVEVRAQHRGPEATERRVVVGGPAVKNCIHRRALEAASGPAGRISGPLCPACAWEAPILDRQTEEAGE